MPFVFLLVFGLICLQTRWPDPVIWMNPDEGVFVFLAGLGLFVLTAFFTTARWIRRIHAEPYLTSDLKRRFIRFRSLHTWLLSAYYLASLYLLGWGAFVSSVWANHLPRWPGFEVAVFAPLPITLCLCWTFYYYVERSIYHSVNFERSYIRPGDYLLLVLRHHFLLVVPPIFLLLIQQSVQSLFPDLHENDALASATSVALLALAIFFIPYLLRIFLGLRPLASCGLRTRLLLLANRLRFRFSNILFWNTQGTVANAMVAGVLPWVRYVILTDRLIDELTDDELEAVFAHEIGHIRHHHLAFYILFFLATSLVCAGLVWVVELFVAKEAAEYAWANEWLVSLEPLFNIVGVLAVSVYVVVVFGYFSRSCEHQADIFGAKAVSVPVFVEALEKVARINGISRDRPGWFAWQHPTIARRVEFLERMEWDPSHEPRFQRNLSWIRWSIVSLCVVGAIIVGVTTPPEAWFDVLK